MNVAILLSFCACLAMIGIINGQSDGSKCPGTSCSPPMPGAQCDSKYDRDDGCCPVWTCTQNGYTSTIYGKMSSGSGGSSSSSYSSSSGNGGSFFSQSSSSNTGIGGGFKLGGLQLQLPGFANLFG